ncbi:ROK family protein [Kitasatospora sp. LaBMicrA B282]|uniref:ROK family protein n=1 Tax=Kitasatospora sp. LaBMicrA B282 TaxID=3420949 RepID=UPI003D0E55F6
MVPLLLAEPVNPPAAGRLDGAAAVLRTALRYGPVARGEIGRRTGLSPAAVSRHGADLLALGLVREPRQPAAAPRPGRPRIPLEVDTGHHLAAGVHLAVSRLTFALVDLRGRVVAREELARRPGAAVAEDLGRLRDHLPGFLRRHAAGRSVLGLGAVTGGWVDPDRGRVVANSALGWRDVPLRAEIEQATRLPVHLDNHARALAGAELLFGPGPGGDLVHLFVGNAVDAAIVTGGHVLRGRHNGAGGIAHLPVPGATPRCPCGAAGCLQATVADRAVADRAVAAGLLPRPDLGLLLAAARAGEPRAVELCRSRLRLLARPIGLLLDMLNPHALVLTEGVALFLPELLPVLHEALAEQAGRRVEQVVRAGAFGSDTLAVAAAAPVLAAVYQDPLALRTGRTR